MLTHSYSRILRSNATSSSFKITRRLYSIQKGRLNEDILQHLHRCKEEEERKSDANSFRVIAYVKAIQAVSRVKHTIQASNEIQELPGIGPGIMNRIDDFLYETSTLGKSTPNLQEVVKSRNIAQLSKLPKIGPATAKKLVEAGCHSVVQLNEPTFLALLSPKQRIAIRFLGHLDQPIPREDATHILDFCQDSLDKSYELLLVGEYRRNALCVPDIQLMILHPDFVHVPLPSDPSPFSIGESSISADTPPKNRRRSSKFIEEKPRNILHDDIVPLLLQRGLLVDTFTKTSTKWEGVVRLPGPRLSWGTRLERMSSIENADGMFRRMSIHLVSQKSRGSALLSLTGDSAFLKDISQKAKQQGMLLNDHGLWKWVLSDPPSALTDDFDYSAAKGYWSMLNSASEEEIVDELGIPLVQPEKRNFNYLMSRLKPRRF